MRNEITLNTLLLTAPLMFSSWAFAAASAPAAEQHGVTAEQHAEKGEGRGAAAREKSAKPVAWTAFPTLKTRMGGEGRESKIVTVVPQSIVANSINAYSSDARDAKGHRQLPLDMAGARLDRPETGGFHWLFAREEQADKVRVASTVYFFSNPGKNPTAMFMQQKHELEIIPQPFPREHSRYRANENWKFLVRFNGTPLVGQKIYLETANGTKSELESNAQGVVTLHVPDDFAAEAGQKASDGHGHGRRSGDFVLATEHADSGKSYLTAFNASYGPDAYDQRSLAMGLGFVLLGMAGAVPLLRQRKPVKKSAAVRQVAGAPAATVIIKKEEA